MHLDADPLVRIRAIHRWRRILRAAILLALYVNRPRPSRRAL